MIILLIMVTIIVIAMVIFLKNENKSKVTLTIISSALFIGAISVYLDAAYFGHGGMLRGVGIIFAIFFYVIPLIFMLNFVLFAMVFNDITLKLRGKLKIWTAISLISFSIYIYAYGIDFPWLPELPESFYIIVIYTSSVLCILSTVIVCFAMFVDALKTTVLRDKKKWIVIAFFCPIIGSLLYFIFNKIYHRNSI